jgi:hypothetical protein
VIERFVDPFPSPNQLMINFRLAPHGRKLGELEFNA